MNFNFKNAYCTDRRIGKCSPQIRVHVIKYVCFNLRDKSTKHGQRVTVTEHLVCLLVVYFYLALYQIGSTIRLVCSFLSTVFNYLNIGHIMVWKLGCVNNLVTRMKDRGENDERQS